MTLLAAFKVLLYRYTGSTDIVVGCPVASRHLPELESLIGFFLSTLVLRTDLSDDPTFQDVLGRVRDMALGAYAHRDIPFEQLVEELQPQRDMSYTPLFQVMFVLQNAPMPDMTLSGLTLRPFEFDSGAAKFDLTLYLKETATGLVGAFEYNTDLFKAATIARLIGHFQQLLAGIAAQPEHPISQLPLLTQREQHQLLVEWNESESEYPQTLCLHQLFAAQVERTPDKTAVVCANQKFTYRELNAKANQLAHYLRTLGVRPGVLVGICVTRSLDMVVGLLGILKAGGAYVPLDPSYPAERLTFMLADAQVSVLLTQESLVDSVPHHQAQVVCLDVDWASIASYSDQNPLSEATPDHLAYVIYTSGSTGQPKGVQILHRALVNFLSAMRLTPGLTEADTLLSVTTLSFDIAALELYLPLIVGACLVIVSRDVATDGAQLLTQLTSCNATVMQATPATWRMLLASGWQGHGALKILCGGEALDRDLALQLLECGAELWNLYGPTETTIWSAIQKVDSQQDSFAQKSIVSIGRPIANTQFYVLDRMLQPVPVGVPGELHIGGCGLAQGYLNRPDLTTERFIPNPFSPDPTSRLYKTGDLVRYQPDGTLEYLSRIDDQVKLRGFRLELGEIEAVLSRYPIIREAAVVVRRDKPDSQRLVAYVVLDAEQTLNRTELHSFLASKLPQYMVPSTLVRLEALPLTPNGKVDRRSLPAPDSAQVQDNDIFVAPSTPIEEMLAGIWSEVLGLEQVSIHDNFFELGGHSLLATQVMSRLRQVFAIELSLRRLFEDPTIARLAQVIETATHDGLEPLITPIAAGMRDRGFPLSFAQERVWFLTQLEPDNSFYNISGAIRLQGPLNGVALEQSLNEILRRHEVLRTQIDRQTGQPIAIISPVSHLPLSVIDLSALPPDQQDLEVRQRALAEARQAFDLTSAPLLRVKLLRLSEQDHVMLFTMHHIVADGWSLNVIRQELSILYEAFCNGQPSPLLELPIQYADFAAWQRQRLRGDILEAQLSYWRQQLDGAPPLLDLPTDYPRPAIQTYQGATHSFQLSQTLVAALKTLSQQAGATLFMTLLAAFQILLHRYTGSEDVVVGSPIANRNQAETEGLIGFFVNTLALRVDLSGNPTFTQVLHRVCQVALEAYAHQDAPFEQLVEELQPQRDVSYNPLFQVMFVLQNAPRTKNALSDLTLSPLAIDGGAALFDLTLYIDETDEGLLGVLEYNTDLFEAATITRMAGHLQQLLNGIVADPEQPISALPLLTDAERHQLLVKWSETCSHAVDNRCIHELFEAQVERTPQAISVTFEDQSLTYQQLNQRANQLAHHLMQLGVGPEVPVGLFVARSLDMIIGLLGILKAGGAYVPLDPAYPQSRLAFILSDARAPFLLTQQPLVDHLPSHDIRIICLDTGWDSIAQEHQENPASSTRSENLAYVIYTSGSTGEPKGVLGLHQGAVNRFHWMWKTYPFQAQEICCQKTSLSFVDSIWEIFGPLLQGIQIVIVPDLVLKDPRQFVETLARYKVTRLILVPSLLRLLLDTHNDLQTQLPQLKIWVTSGEVLSLDLLETFRQALPESTLLNLYGSSEVSADVTGYSVSPRDEIPAHVPIGRPIANTQIYVLNQSQQPVPIGVPGELYVGGTGLARGYLNRPALTAEKFITTPFENSRFNRLYRTGDLVRYLSDGNLEFLGRLDDQVKLRGFRIELGEITASLIQHPDIQEAIVLTREDESGCKQLVAYVVPQMERALRVSDLHQWLNKILPNYMAPSNFMMLNALPQLPNGKIDRRALPNPESVRPKLASAYQAPQTETEQLIASIWQDVLHVEDVGIHDSFFELGGHSLRLIQVQNKLYEQLQRDLPLVVLFQYPTIHDLTQYLRQEHPVSTGQSRPSRRRAASTKRHREIRQKRRADSKNNKGL